MSCISRYRSLIESEAFCLCWGIIPVFLDLSPAIAGYQTYPYVSKAAPFRPYLVCGKYQAGELRFCSRKTAGSETGNSHSISSGCSYKFIPEPEDVSLTMSIFLAWHFWMLLWMEGRAWRIEAQTCTPKQHLKRIAAMTRRAAWLPGNAYCQYILINVFSVTRATMHHEI